MQGFTSICTHFVIFLTQKPKQRSKDQKQVRVDLQGMNTSLTCLHLSLHFKVKNTQKRTLQIHISRKSEVYIGHAYRETRAHAHTRTRTHAHTHTHTHTPVWFSVSVFSRCHMMSNSMWLIQADQTRRSILPEILTDKKHTLS